MLIIECVSNLLSYYLENKIKVNRRTLVANVYYFNFLNLFLECIVLIRFFNKKSEFFLMQIL